jgi:hypothetical protein
LFGSQHSWFSRPQVRPANEHQVTRCYT